MSRFKKGFSLIEVMVTLAIIAVVTSVVMPGFQSIQLRAKEMALKSTVRSLQISLEDYRFDKGAYPSGSNVTMTQLVSKLESAGILIDSLKNPYTGTSYTENDSSGQIAYSYSSDGYTIQLYGRSKTDLIDTFSVR